MGTTNGNGKVKVAILQTDLKYVKESQDLLSTAVMEGFKEIKLELNGIKGTQQANANEILAAKSSIKTLRWVFGGVVTIVGLGLTVYGALR